MNHSSSRPISGVKTDSEMNDAIGASEFREHAEDSREERESIFKVFQGILRRFAREMRKKSNKGKKMRMKRTENAFLAPLSQA